MDLEWLRNGSEFHNVSPVGPDEFLISVADASSEECKERFHQIVEEAMGSGGLDGYKIRNPHPSSMDPKGRWDCAIVKISHP
jgi:hypothetical protein